MTTHAHGTFDVKMTPQSAREQLEGPIPGRMLIDKQFHGDLEAVSQGQMLAAMTEVKGSAGYVAIEQVTGTLRDGNGRARSGSFILQHFGIMNRGEPQQSVTIVPDSGTGQLVGIAGTMAILITDGKHSFDFAYDVPDEC
jgi:hypothetical protein